MKAFIFIVLIWGLLGLGACATSSDKPTPSSNLPTVGSSPNTGGTPLPNFATPTPPAPATTPKPKPSKAIH